MLCQKLVLAMELGNCFLDNRLLHPRLVSKEISGRDGHVAQDVYKLRGSLSECWDLGPQLPQSIDKVNLQEWCTVADSITYA